MQDIETHGQIQRTRTMKKCQLFQTYRTYGYELIGMIHHGDQKVQEHDNIDDRVSPEHQHSPEPGEALDASQLKVVQIDEAKHSPEQCLSRLKQTANRQKVLLVTIHLTLQRKILSWSNQRSCGKYYMKGEGVGAVSKFAYNLMFILS